MNRMKKLWNGKWIASFMAVFALVFVNMGANATCCWLFHQPEKPDLKKFRKF